MKWKLRAIATIAILILLAVSAWFGYSKGKQSGMQEVQILWDSEKLGIAQAINEELIRGRARERRLQSLANKMRQEKRHEADRLAAEYAADVERLRNRYEARAGESGLPTGSAAGVGCTGAGLARPDAAFLAGYAFDAAKLKSALDECRVKYEAISKEQ